MTAKGAELAARLIRAMPEEGVGIGWLVGICSTICRHGAAYNTIQERWCNEEMSEAQTAAVEKREAQLERLINEHVASLPLAVPRDGHEEAPWATKFEGDPRGFTVMIVAPEGWRTLHNSGAGDGIGVA